MGLFTKAINGHNHNDALNTRELGHSMGYNLIQDVFYKGAGLGDDYENVYEFVRPLAERFSRIMPYAIDSNGKTVDEVPAVNALYRPNKQMSYTQFFDALMTGIKTQPEIYILVWSKKGGKLIRGGKITRDNIAGYTFLQGVSKINTNGVISYQISNSTGELENFTTDEVIVLSDSRNPANINIGYSPLKAVQKWITVDDYIVAYQQGFFRNGAVPTGQFIITAATAQDFKDTVKQMQNKHRGAGQNNNVTYTFRPAGENGKPMANAQVEWVPFNVANKDMELGVLTENIQKRKESVYGVPGVIRGVDDSANYATAQVMERSFVVNKLDPATHNIWSTWTHELNRITGGLGIAITYDLEIPAVADEEKVMAETKTLEAQLITTLTEQGYSLDTIIDAFELSNGYKTLKKGSGTPVIENDKPQVDEGNEVNDSPDENGGSKSTNPKVKVLSKREAAEVNDTVESVARKHMSLQIDKAISDIKAIGDPTDEAVYSFADDLLLVLIASMAASGEIEYAAGIQLLSQSGLSTAATSQFRTTATQVEAYRQYLRGVAESYSRDTALSIRQALDKANVEGVTFNQLKKDLRNIMNTDEYRVVRIARTETNYSQQMGSLESIRQIQNETGYALRKVWNTSRSDACEFCRALNGTVIELDKAFIPLNGVVVGEDGGILVNDFHAREETTAHPNCSCFLTYEVVGS